MKRTTSQVCTSRGTIEIEGVQSGTAANRIEMETMDNPSACTSRRAHVPIKWPQWTPYPSSTISDRNRCRSGRYQRKKRKQISTFSPIFSSLISGKSNQRYNLDLITEMTLTGRAFLHGRSLGARFFRPRGRPRLFHFAAAPTALLLLLCHPAASFLAIFDMVSIDPTSWPYNGADEAASTKGGVSHWKRHLLAQTSSGSVARPPPGSHYSTHHPVPSS
jgi:hypothetical protein